MSRFLVERSSPPLSEEELSATAQQVIAISNQLGITWIKSYYSAKDGKWYCEYESPNAELIWQHARLGQFPLPSRRSTKASLRPSAAAGN